MQIRKRNSRGIMFSLLIIVISFVYAINVQPVVFGEPGCISTTGISDHCYSSNDNSDFLAKSSPLPHNCDDDCFYSNVDSKTTIKRASIQEDSVIFSSLSYTYDYLIKNIFTQNHRFVVLYEDFVYIKN